MQDHTIDLKEKDYKNFIVCFFIPPEARPISSIIFLFDYELSTVCFKARDPLARSVRFQWWREALEDLHSNKSVNPRLLEDIKSLKISTENFNEIISLHEAISTASFLPDQKSFDELFMKNSNALTFIADYTDQPQDKRVLRKLYKISFLTHLLMNFFLVLEGSLLKPFTQEMIARFEYNPDFVKDEVNHQKLILMHREVHSKLLEELHELEAQLVKPSNFLNAYIYNIKHNLKILQKNHFDLKKTINTNKFIYLLSLLWNVF